MTHETDSDDFTFFVFDDEGAWGPITKYSPPELLASLRSGRTSSEDCQIVEFTSNGDDDDPGAMTATNA